MARPKPKKPKRPACRKTTKTGAPCRNRALPGSQFCGSHGGGATKCGPPEKIHDHRIVEAIIDSVSKGVTYEIAARAAGIHADTFAEWRRKGRRELQAQNNGAKPDPDLAPYAQLVTDLHDAQGQAEAQIVKWVHAAARDDWRAGIALLERRHPERWGKRDHVDVNVSAAAQPREIAPLADKRAQVIDVLQTALQPPRSDAA